MPQLRYLPDVVTLQFDESKCTGCRTCTMVCPHAVWQMNGKRARLADLDACMECGACAKNCPESAIAVRAGVGCATAVLNSMLYGGAPSCGCSSEGEPSCCAPQA